MNYLSNEPGTKPRKKPDNATLITNEHQGNQQPSREKKSQRERNAHTKHSQNR